MRIGKFGRFILLLFLCLTLSGCRTRTTGSVERNGESETGPTSAVSLTVDGAPDGDEAKEQEKNTEPGEQTKDNPQASRKEYDENAPAEIVPGTERTVHGEGEGDGAFAEREGAEESAAKLNDGAEETAARTEAAEQAEQMGVSEDAKEAESALTYYTVLLQERTGSLFECQRLNVYWETAEDHVTIFKTSPEHSLILNAGAYDVSARLMEENLRVDDGWIGRKNPGVIVKVVDSGVLESGAARKVYADLLARDGWSAIDAVRNGRVLLISEELLTAPHRQVAAMLALAKVLYPAQMADVDPEQALKTLEEEASGISPVGIFFYSGQGGF